MRSPDNSYYCRYWRFIKITFLIHYEAWIPKKYPYVQLERNWSYDEFSEEASSSAIRQGSIQFIIHTSSTPEGKGNQKIRKTEISKVDRSEDTSQSLQWAQQNKYSQNWYHRKDLRKCSEELVLAVIGKNVLRVSIIANVLRIYPLQWLESIS